MNPAEAKERIRTAASRMTVHFGRLANRYFTYANLQDRRVRIMILPSLVAGMIVLVTFYAVSIRSGGTSRAPEPVMLSTPRWPRKVIIIAYTSLSSTFVGEIFNQNEDACYWYDIMEPILQHIYGFLGSHKPLDIFYDSDGQRRKLPQAEVENILHYLTTILSNPSSNTLPLEILANDYIWQSRWAIEIKKCLVLSNRHRQETFSLVSHRNEKCRACLPEPNFHQLSRCYLEEEKVKGYNTTDSHVMDHEGSDCFSSKTSCHRNCLIVAANSLRKCFNYVDSGCADQPLHALKTVRLTMDSAIQLLERDSNIKIVHYVIDPRSIFITHQEGGDWMLADVSRNDSFREMQLQCQFMVENLNMAEKLEAKYPGRILLVKHEDFMNDPVTSAEAIYSHIGLELPVLTHAWILRTLVPASKRRLLKPAHTDSRDETSHWVKNILLSDTQRVNEICSQVLQRYSYTSFPTIY